MPCARGRGGDGGGGAHRQLARVSVPYAQFRDGREATCVLVLCDCYSSAISVRRCFSDPDHPKSRILQLCPDDLTSKPYSVSTIIILVNFTSIISVDTYFKSAVFFSTFPSSWCLPILYRYGKSFAEKNLTYTCTRLLLMVDIHEIQYGAFFNLLR